MRSFYSKMETESFNAYGILDSDNKIHTLGTDSKIIGRIFEMFAQPLLEEIASENHMILKTPESQTVYPDFIMMHDARDRNKIAIDIKTTYVENSYSTIKFTLGSYASYMRNNTKNIEYPYTDFAKHYVIGFVYERNGNAQESKIVNYSDRTNIEYPYTNVRYFIQEKYKIAGDKPGSGNTENIGSISTNNFSDFKDGRGPFAELGQDIYDLYWKYYPKYRAPDRAYTSLTEFLRWIPNQNNLKLLHAYNHDAVLENVREYISNHHIL